MHSYRDVYNRPTGEDPGFWKGVVGGGGGGASA